MASPHTTLRTWNWRCAAICHSRRSIRGSARRRARSACRSSDVVVSTPPTTSVIIVAWQVRELLRACLRSIAAHEDCAALDVWVVDNASTDGTAALVAAEFPWVRLIPLTENRGF